jgi:hypothetical protein
MHTIEIPEIKKTLYLPENLAECDQQQYIDMSQLLILNQTGELDYEAMRIQAVYKLLDIKRVKTEDETDKLSNIYLISQLIDSFFIIDNNGQKSIKSDFFECPIQSFNPYIIPIHGPKSFFNDITFGEYLDALRLFFQFQATPDITLLKAITAILLRREEYTTSKRIPYNPDKVDKAIENLKYAPVGLFYGVYLWFAAFQKFISTAQIPWADKTLNFSLLFDASSNDNKTEHEDIGMDSIFFALAENGTFGNAKETKQTKLIEVLIKMYDMRIKELNQKSNDNSKPTT